MLFHKFTLPRVSQKDGKTPELVNRSESGVSDVPTARQLQLLQGVFEMLNHRQQRLIIEIRTVVNFNTTNIFTALCGTVEQSKMVHVIITPRDSIKTKWETFVNKNS